MHPLSGVPVRKHNLITPTVHAQLPRECKKFFGCAEWAQVFIKIYTTSFYKISSKLHSRL